MRNICNALPDAEKEFPIDLLYAECKHCRTPLLWKEEQSKRVLKALNVRGETLSLFSMFVSSGCPNCEPSKEQYAIDILDTRKTPYQITATQKSFWSKNIK
ncbi:MAG: hypothetical protein K2M30_03225 [Desulfovibrionaceae bacterium]|nr:hypothetical protein [Desulfovibrionaceae bacterium]MDE7469280.1 hypothetical protein [Desulfovibrionaceae bacterium]